MRWVVSLSLSFALLLGGCGEDGAGEDGGRGVTFDTAVLRAQAVDESDFPSPAGRTLQEMASTVPAINVGLATSVYTPGENRLAFGLIDETQSFVYGKTAVYLARGPNVRAIGPFPAPADPLVVEPPFRSEGAADVTTDIAAIYEARVDLPSPGKWYVLAFSKARGKMFGAAAQIKVARSSPIPAVGEPVPRVSTDTVASADGDIEAIDTREPPDDMHSVDFQDVAGEKPVALLFATPQLCETRVCGPVVDIAAQMKAEYGDRIEFIHQEVFVDNEIQKGLRPPLRAFELQTEPWLFTIDRQGRVAARVEGSFGNEAFREAIEAAL